jgi:hypothetical protein
MEERKSETGTAFPETFQWHEDGQEGGRSLPPTAVTQ